MDTQPMDMPTPDPLDPLVMAKAMEADLAELQAVGEKMGVRKDEPFGAFFMLMFKAQRRFAESNLAGVLELRRIAANARLAVEDDILRLRQDQEEMAQLNAGLRRVVTEAVAGAQRERQDLHEDLVTRILPKLYKVLERPLVIRETRHNYETLMAGVVTIAGVVVVIFLSGFSVSLWADWRGSKRLDDFQIAFASCEVAKPIVDADGVRYCLHDPFRRRVP